ncbi:MAG: response regulator transcription factor [Bacteroidetes bacterium]|nr:response regulator transcription factor [Bacteroidota bacterium]
MAVAKILIIEDEPKVARFIKKGLEDNEFEADIAFDGRIGLNMASSGSYHAIILDINLPQVNGYEVCREIRSYNSNIPVLMLTAMGTTKDKLQGFDAGTDDYLVKPFEFRELLARIRVLLKRSQSGLNPENSGNVLRIADLVMDLSAKSVTRDGKKINLTAKEFSLLEFFLKNRGRVLSRSEIAENVWDISFDTGTNIIDVYINFLRNKIDKNFFPKLIHTLIGMRYVLKEED